MPKAIKKRTKKKDIAVEAEVQDRISDIKEMMQKKQKAVITYGGAAVVVVLVIAGLLFVRYNNREKARQLADQAYSLYYNENREAPQQRKEQLAKAADLFNQAYNTHKSPRLLLYLANSYAEGEKLDDAVTTLNLFIRNYASEKKLLPIAYQQLANVQVMRGNKADALKTLDTLYKSSGNIFKDLALIETARLLESEGKKDEATAKYKELVEKFSASPYADEARAKLGTVEKKEG